MQSVRGHPNSVPPMPHASNDLPYLLSLCVNTAVNKVNNNKSTFPVEPMTFTPHTRRADRVCDGLSRSGGIGGRLSWWIRGSRAGAEDRECGLSLGIACYVRSKICPDKLGRARVLTSLPVSKLAFASSDRSMPATPWFIALCLIWGHWRLAFASPGHRLERFYLRSWGFIVYRCRKVNRIKVLGSKSNIDS